MGRRFHALPVIYLPTAPSVGNKSNLSVQQGLRELETVADALRPEAFWFHLRPQKKYFQTPRNLTRCFRIHPGATCSSEKKAAWLTDWSWSSGRDEGGQIIPLGTETTAAGESLVCQPWGQTEFCHMMCRTLSWQRFACWSGEGEAGEGEETHPQQALLYEGGCEENPTGTWPPRDITILLPRTHLSRRGKYLLFCKS